MLKLAKIIRNKKKKEDISALRKSADTLKDYSATSIVDKIDKIDKIDQTDHTNSSTFNQIENTSTDNFFNVESTTSTEEDPVWSTIEWNVQSSGIDEVSVITSNVWNDDNQQQVRNIRSKKDGILRDDFEENVWADVQIVSSLPNYSFLAAELSNDLAQSENHSNKIPLTLHEKVGQLAQETLRNQGLLTPPRSPTSQNIEKVPSFSSTKENIEDKAINYKAHTPEIDQMDYFSSDASFDVSNIKTSFDDPLAESSEGDKDITYNENIDGYEDFFIVNRKVDGNISSDSKESIDSAEYSYIKDSEINGQEVDRKSNITIIENDQNESSDFGEFVSAENVQTLPECSSFLPEFKEISSSVNDDNSLNPNLKQDAYNNSPESTPQDTWMSLSDLSFLEYITNTKTTSPKISSSEPHRDLLLDFNNFISLLNNHDIQT
ncbi:hypothetical protein C2G38_2096335 [Gigaspora rosea]|uniref:Uncharacterized protein n=1 Tax=Gigaspora rosea TaxID=44941 RepID=A0A397UZT3_9GLOM|nr:hypothetical protein C2G38_2096335 [Gigaspora rosea]